MAVRAAGDGVVALGGADVARQRLAAGSSTRSSSTSCPSSRRPSLFGGALATATLTKLRVADAPERHAPALPRESPSTGSHRSRRYCRRPPRGGHDSRSTPVQPVRPRIPGRPVPVLRPPPRGGAGPRVALRLRCPDPLRRRGPHAPRREFSRDIEAHATPPEEPGARARRREAIRARREEGELRRPSSTSTRPTTPASAGWCRWRSPRRPSSGCARASRRSSTTSSTAPPSAVDRARRRAGLPRAVPGHLRPARAPDRAQRRVRAWSEALTAALEPTADEATMDAAEHAACRPVGVPPRVIADRRRTSATTCCRT